MTVPVRSLLVGARAWAQGSAGALLRLARRHGEAGTPSGEAPAQRAAAVQRRFEELVYELLDAHERTTRLAAELEWDPEWREHLDFLRQLQRVSREVLSAASSSPGPICDRVP